MSEAKTPSKPHLSLREENEYPDSGTPSTAGHDEPSSRTSRGPHEASFRLPGFFSALSLRSTNNHHTYDYQLAPTEDMSDSRTRIISSHARAPLHNTRRLKLLKRIALVLPLAIFALLGLLHVIMVILGRKSLFWDVEEYGQYLPDWSRPGHPGEDLGHYPTDATRDIRPIPCHSHNDYWRRVPLFDAIHAGCISVEADVWLFKGQEDLYVGHDTASLTPDRTFASLYIDPLVQLLDNMNPDTEFSSTKGHGVFDEDPNQTLILLIDFKTNGRELFPRVREQLEPLRNKGYLSFWTGSKFNSRPITAVGTGNTPFDLIVANTTYRDIFFDAPLDEIYEDPSDNRNDDTAKSMNRAEKRGQGKTGTTGTSADDFDSSNSFYASTSLKNHVGYPFTGKLSSHQLNRLRGQIKGARQRGLKSRYWDTPSWPTSLRNHIWQILIEEGADILNVDDLQAASRLDWNFVRHDWIDA